MLDSSHVYCVFWFLRKMAHGNTWPIFIGLHILNYWAMEVIDGVE